MNATKFGSSLAILACFGVTALAAPGGIPGAPGGGEETTGNNLSFPVIWSDGVAIALRGDPYPAAVFDGRTVAATDEGGVLWDWYVQQDAANIWQAETADAVTQTVAPVDVDWIDWGDNLEARAWNVNSVVRVELTLLQNLDNAPFPPLNAYQMLYLYGQGPSEMWGTNAQTYLSNTATVYSHCARLTIQKLNRPREQVANIQWDPTTSQWVGADAGNVQFTGAVFEAGDGPGFYSAEINISGRAIYGFNWFVRKQSEGAGDYRLTFNLDGTDPARPCYNGAEALTLNTDFSANTQVVPFGEEEAAAAPPTDDNAGGIVGLVPEYNLTYIDVRILPRSGGGGTGGGAGGGGAGNGHGGGGPGGGAGGGGPDAINAGPTR